MWLIGLSFFFEDRKQRVVVDGIVTGYLNINRGVPQGNVFGPVLRSIMVNDFKSGDPMNILVKFVDDITLGIPGKEDGDTSRVEVDN